MLHICRLGIVKIWKRKNIDGEKGRDTLEKNQVEILENEWKNQILLEFYQIKKIYFFNIFYVLSSQQHFYSNASYFICIFSAHISFINPLFEFYSSSSLYIQFKYIVYVTGLM